MDTLPILLVLCDLNQHLKKYKHMFLKQLASLLTITKNELFAQKHYGK